MKTTVLAFVFTCLSVLCFSQAPTEKALLWKISGNNLQAPSYLYGTFHLLCPEDLVFDSTLTEALQGSKTLFLELDMTDQKVMMQAFKGSVMQDGKTLKDLYENDVYQVIHDSLKAMTSMPMMMLEKMKPALVVSAIYPSLLGCSVGSPEMNLANLAKKNGTVVKGLESVEEQMAAFDAIPLTEQAEMLRSYLLEAGEAKKELIDMLMLYRAKDLMGMASMFENTEEGWGKYEEDLLIRRNKAWISRIAEQTKIEQTFFAVGAGHLGGEQGVISLLRKVGFTVEPVY
jgi:uncharacterized protein YbaP (TraB family)